MIAVVQVMPEIERMKARSTIESVESGFLELDEAILELIAEGSYGSGSSLTGSSRIVSIHTPQGTIGVESGLRFNMWFLDDLNQKIEFENETTSFIENVIYREQMGQVDYQINTNYKFLPAGKTRYLTGTSPDTKRDHVLVSGFFSGQSTEDMSPTNLTLSREEKGGIQHISLDYRIRIRISYESEIKPTLRFDVILIKLIGDSSQSTRQYERVKTLKAQIISNMKPILYNSSVITSSSISLRWSSLTGASVTGTEVWSSSRIPGLPISSLSLEVRPVIFEVMIS